jgi:hypothetical protein
MFGYLVPWSADVALDKVTGTRLDIGKGWTASNAGQGSSFLGRPGWEPPRPGEAILVPPRKTAEGWSYYGHASSLSAFLRPRIPEAVPFLTLRGETILLPLAQLAPQAIVLSTGGPGDFVDEWARQAFRLHEGREFFSEGGKDYWRLSGTDADLARVMLQCIQAVYCVTAEALTDCRVISTADRAAMMQAVWGYTLGKPRPAGGGG